MNDKIPACTTGRTRHHWSRAHNLVGGVRENPGVWSVGGTAFRFESACTACKCHRVEYAPGPQERRGGKRRSVTYTPAGGR